MLKRLKRKSATTDYAVKSIQVASKRVLKPTSLCLTAFNLIRVIEKDYNTVRPGGTAICGSAV